MEQILGWAIGIALAVTVTALSIMIIDLFLLLGADIIMEHRRRTKLWKDIQDLYREIKRDRIDL